jgi:hypothetical protein
MATPNDLLTTVQARLANGENMNDISNDLHLGTIESMYLQDGKVLTGLTSTQK